MIFVMSPLKDITIRSHTAMTAVLSNGGDVLENAIEENVRQNVAALKNASPVLNAAFDKKRAASVSGVYRLATDTFDFIV
jgi:carbonic anhydrase